MKFDKRDLLLYAVTDRRWTGEETLYTQVEKALTGGATFVQLREKNLSETEVLEEAREIQALCRKYGVPFVIDDDVELAVKIGADGVHVGQSDLGAAEARKRIGPDKILGVSAQTIEQARQAEAQGADYLGVGAVFSTGSKDDAVEVDHQRLRRSAAGFPYRRWLSAALLRKTPENLRGEALPVSRLSVPCSAPKILKKRRGVSERLLRKW